MAYQTQDIGQYLKRRASGQGVVTAADVAVVYDTETGIMSESLKDRLDALSKLDLDSLKEEVSKLQTKITDESRLDSDLVAYTTKDGQETTVKKYLDDLLLSVSNSSLLPFAKEANPSTGTLGEYLQNISASDITYLKSNVQTTLQSALDSLDGYETSCSQAASSAYEANIKALEYAHLASVSERSVSSSKELLDTIKSQYDRISSVANDLKASLDLSSSDILVISEEAYNNLSSEEKANGTIYMLYNTNDNDHYCIVGMSINPVMGVVTGTNTHAYINTLVRLVAQANTGYKFLKWTRSTDSSYSSTESSLTITAAENVTYLAHFEIDETTG